MTINAVEAQRLRDGMKGAVGRHYNSFEWRFYYSRLLGRDVTMAETDTFLREVAEEEARCVNQLTA